MSTLGQFLCWTPYQDWNAWLVSKELFFSSPQIPCAVCSWGFAPGTRGKDWKGLVGSALLLGGLSPLKGGLSPSPSRPGGQQPAIHCLPPPAPPTTASFKSRSQLPFKGSSSSSAREQCTASLRRNMMQYFPNFPIYCNIQSTVNIQILATLHQNDNAGVAMIIWTII